MIKTVKRKSIYYLIIELIQLQHSVARGEVIKVLILILLIIIVMGVAIIDGRLKKKLENDKRIIERLDVLINELRDIRKK
ncbi:hypothetical protein BS614_15745 [Paenibacillus xylanexedens]|uniref:hypothetical protein n=1 Tax=Paenibacillus xylanexedens TaxID=528191 RepID=UPI000938150F|nr:hypothetical protein [Paenibacillus xylanexedens]APO45325.1 hypothetical protein BS614_15745 [Paenibacillus xylanexedens]